MTLTIIQGRSKRAKQPKVRKAVLVYQAGIANVFAVESFNMANYGRDAWRLLQADFRTCESFARGLAAAGVLVASAACNVAGDIISFTWSEDLDAQPFSDKFHPVFAGVMPNNEPRLITCPQCGNQIPYEWNARGMTRCVSCHMLFENPETEEN